MCCVCSTISNKHSGKSIINFFAAALLLVRIACSREQNVLPSTSLLLLMSQKKEKSQ